MTRMARFCLAALGVALTPSLALAHPDFGHVHGVMAGLAHPLGGIDHLFAMIGVGLWAAQLGGRAVWALPLGFMAALTIGGGLGMARASMLFVEPGILGSLVVIGLAVALAWRVSTTAGFALVAAFALFHGYAHGAEMPSGISALGYAAGFLAATALLHVFGIGMGLVARRLDHPLLTRSAGAAISAAGLVLMLG